MMVNTAATFLFTILTLYTFYRYILHQDEFFKDLSLLHLKWQLFYLSVTLTVIYTANQVAREVNVGSLFNECT